MLRLKTAVVLAIRYLFLTRYSWLLALGLLSLVPLSLNVMPRLLANLFVFDLPQQIYHVSWISMWCAATVMETLRATTMNAHLRFDDYRIAAEQFRDAWGIEVVDDTVDWYRNRVGWLMMLLGLAAAIGVWHQIMHACIESTVHDPSATWISHVGTSDEADMRAFGWNRAIAGLLTTLTLLGVLNAVMILLHERALRIGVSKRPAWLRMIYESLHAIMGPGYCPNGAFVRFADDVASGTGTLSARVVHGDISRVVRRELCHGDGRPTDAHGNLALCSALLRVVILTVAAVFPAWLCVFLGSVSYSGPTTRFERHSGVLRDL